MKIKLFVAREIQYFELWSFSFNSYIYYLTRAFNLQTRAFNLATRAFNLATRAFNFATCAFSLLTHRFELVTRAFELVTRVLLFLCGKGVETKSQKDLGANPYTEKTGRGLPPILNRVKVKRIQEIRVSQFLFQNVQNNEIFEISKMSKNNC